MVEKPFPEGGTVDAKIQWMNDVHGFVDYGALDPCLWCGHIHCVCIICPRCDKKEGECTCGGREE